MNCLIPMPVSVEGNGLGLDLFKYENLELLPAILTSLFPFFLPRLFTFSPRSKDTLPWTPVT